MSMNKNLGFSGGKVKFNGNSKPIYFLLFLFALTSNHQLFAAGRPGNDRTADEIVTSDQHEKEAAKSDSGIAILESNPAVGTHQKVVPSQSVSDNTLPRLVIKLDQSVPVPETLVGLGREEYKNYYERLKIQFENNIRTYGDQLDAYEKKLRSSAGVIESEQGRFAINLNEYAKDASKIERVQQIINSQKHLAEDLKSHKIILESNLAVLNEVKINHVIEEIMTDQPAEVGMRDESLFSLSQKLAEISSRGEGLKTYVKELQDEIVTPVQDLKVQLSQAEADQRKFREESSVKKANNARLESIAYQGLFDRTAKVLNEELKDLPVGKVHGTITELHSLVAKQVRALEEVEQTSSFLKAKMDRLSKELDSDKINQKNVEIAVDSLLKSLDKDSSLAVELQGLKKSMGTSPDSIEHLKMATHFMSKCMNDYNIKLSKRIDGIRAIEQKFNVRIDEAKKKKGGWFSRTAEETESTILRSAAGLSTELQSRVSKAMISSVAEEPKSQEELAVQDIQKAQEVVSDREALMSRAREQIRISKQSLNNLDRGMDIEGKDLYSSGGKQRYFESIKQELKDNKNSIFKALSVVQDAEKNDGRIKPSAASIYVELVQKKALLGVSKGQYDAVIAKLNSAKEEALPVSGSDSSKTVIPTSTKETLATLNSLKVRAEAEKQMQSFSEELVDLQTKLFTIITVGKNDANLIAGRKEDLTKLSEAYQKLQERIRKAGDDLKNADPVDKSGTKAEWVEKLSSHIELIERKVGSQKVRLDYYTETTERAASDLKSLSSNLTVQFQNTSKLNKLTEESVRADKLATKKRFADLKTKAAVGTVVGFWAALKGASWLSWIPGWGPLAGAVAGGATGGAAGVAGVQVVHQVRDGVLGLVGADAYANAEEAAEKVEAQKRRLSKIQEYNSHDMREMIKESNLTKEPKVDHAFEEILQAQVSLEETETFKEQIKNWKVNKIGTLMKDRSWLGKLFHFTGSKEVSFSLDDKKLLQHFEKLNGSLGKTEDDLDIHQIRLKEKEKSAREEKEKWAEYVTFVKIRRDEKIEKNKGLRDTEIKIEHEAKSLKLLIDSLKSARTGSEIIEKYDELLRRGKISDDLRLQIGAQLEKFKLSIVAKAGESKMTEFEVFQELKSMLIASYEKGLEDNRKFQKKIPILMKANDEEVKRLGTTLDELGAIGTVILGDYGVIKEQYDIVAEVAKEKAAEDAKDAAIKNAAKGASRSSCDSKLPTDEMEQCVENLKKSLPLE